MTVTYRNAGQSLWVVVDSGTSTRRDSGAKVDHAASSAGDVSPTSIFAISFFDRAGTAVPEMAFEKQFDIPSFLEEVRRLDAMGDVRGATDEVFDRIDALLQVGGEGLGICNSIIARIDEAHYSSFLLRSFLNITVAVKDKLPARTWFFIRAKDAISMSRGPEKAAKILHGLD